MRFLLNLETAVEDNKVMQDFELESLLMGANYSQKVKAAPIESDSNSKSCITLLSSTAVSRLNIPLRCCFLFLLILQCFFTPALKAQTVTYPSGSLIIPMDSTYQDCGMWPAFGLIYQLLLNDVPVSWAIVQPKTAYNQTDFIGPATAVVLNSPIPTTCPSGNPVPPIVPSHYAFTAGPYIIDGANPAILARAISVINAWWVGGGGTSPVVNQPVVIQATSSFTANVDIVLNKAPVIAIEEINQAIAESYMTAAGIPKSTGSPPFPSGWTLINEGATNIPGSIAGGGLFQSGNICQQRIFDVYVTPHNPGFAYSLTDPTNVGTITYAQLDNFVYLGGGWIALCYSLQTNEDSMVDLTINGSASVKALFKTSLPGGNPGGLLLQGAAKPYSTAPPPPFGGAVPSPNAAFPLNQTQNLGSRWVPDASNLGLPIIQGALPTPPTYPTLTVGFVESWTAPPSLQPIGITPTAGTYPIYWAATRRVSYFDLANPATDSITDPGNTERYDSILDGTYHNGEGAGKISFLAGHWYDNPNNVSGQGPTLPYSTNVAGPYLRAFYNALFLNGNGAVKLQIDVPSTGCLGEDIPLTVVNTGSGTATLDSNIVITLSPDFTYVGTNPSYPPPDTQVGQTLTWFSTTIPTIAAGTTAISMNVQISPATPLGSNQIANLTAQYSDPYSYEYTANACTGLNVATVTTASIIGTNPQNLCALMATSTTLSGNAPNAGAGETGLWTQLSGPAGAIITSPTSPTTIVSGLTGAPVSNVYVFEWTISSTGGFCTSSASATVTVYQTPDQPGAISGLSAVCTGETYTFSVTAVSGATSYTWILPMGWTGSSTTNSITATVGPSASSGTISVTADTTTCTSAAQTLLVTVTATPAEPGAISGPSAVCSGTAYTYSVTAVPGATSYTWTLPSGWTGTSTTNSITATPTGAAASGNITVSANSGSCDSILRTLAVTVTITPAQPGAISGPASVCSGTAYVYSVFPVSGVTSYTWALPSGWTGSSTTNSITATPTPAATNGDISVTANNGACSSAPQTLTVAVIITPTQPGAISGPVSVCSGLTYVYSISAVPGAISYTWTLPSGWTGVSTTNMISVTPTVAAVSGNITVTANNGSCDSVPQTLAVTVTLTPGQSGPISGPSTVCSGVPNTYSIAVVPGAASYTWKLPSGWIGSSTTNSITVTPSTNDGTISVIASNGSCSSIQQMLSVTVTPTPGNAGVISGPSTVCSAVPVTYSIVPVANATSYAWTLPPGWTGTSTTNTITIIPSATSGTVSVTPFNGSCASTPATLVVTATQSPGNAGPISGSSTVCSGVPATYSIAPVANATSYTWTLPYGWTGTSSIDTITVTPAVNSGSITVSPNDGSCAGTSASLPVTLVNSPNIGTISGAAEVCSGSTNIYFTTAVPGATYAWTMPSGWTIIGSSTGYAITATASGGSGNITVVASSFGGTCSSAPQSFAVTVNPLPTVAIIPYSITINKGTSTTLTASGASTYIWSPGDLTGTSIIISPESTITYTVTGTDVHGCINTASATVTVVNSVIVANPDFGSLPDGAAGGTVVANVLANDTLNGSTPTLSTVQLTATAPFSTHVKLNPDGSVSVIPGTPAGVYNIGYTICELINLSNCSSTTVQVTVGAAPILANPDSGTVLNGANGGIAVPNVLANDTLNGVAPTLSNVTLTLNGAPNPYIKLNSDGSVGAIPGTPAGTYVIGYTICEIINPSNCSSTTVTVTVLPPPIAAHPDFGAVTNGSTGGIAISNILANDTLNGIPPTISKVTITPSAPFNTNVTIHTDGSVSVPPGTPAGTYTAGYTICEIVNPTNCSSTIVQVTVGAAQIVANPDAGIVNGSPGGVAVPNVLANDMLNGVVPTLSNVTLTASTPFDSHVTLSSDGSVSVPPGTPAGIYTIGYTICQIMNPANCSSTTVQVTVIESTIVADPDFGAVSNGTVGGLAVANVLANDTLNGMTPTLSTVTLTPTGPISPFVTLNPDGSVSVAPNTPAGVYTIGYEICEILNSVNCSSTIVQVTVGAASIVANPDSGSIPDGTTGGIAVVNVLANDTLNGTTPTLSDVNLTSASPFNSHVILNSDGSVSVAPNTPAGVYTIGYMICQKLNPTNCSSTTVQVAVGLPPIVANPNSGTVPDGKTGGIAVTNVLANDTLNGQPATLLNVNLTRIVTGSPYLVLNVSNGAVSAIPGTPAGVYKLQYQICDKLNPANCSTTTVTVTVLLTPQPPINLKVCEAKLQFAGGTDLMDILSWNPPVGGADIILYRVYANPILTEYVGEVSNFLSECDTVTFTVHNRLPDQKYVYYIVSVDASGEVSVPAKITTL